MLLQVLREKWEVEKVIRLEHNLVKTDTALERFLPTLKESSSNTIEFVYLLKNQRESVFKRFVELYKNEEHGIINILRIMNSNVSWADMHILFEKNIHLFERITELNLASNMSLKDSCLKKLFHTNRFNNLITLNLKNNKLITDEIFTCISGLNTLNQLNLANTNISDQGLHMLVRQKLFKQLVSLNISRNHQIRHLKAFLTVKKKDNQSFGNEQENKDDVEHSQKIYYPENLKYLDLSFTKILPEGMHNLRKIQFVSELESIDLSDNREMIQENELADVCSFKEEDKMINLDWRQLRLRNMRGGITMLNAWLKNSLTQLQILDLEGSEDIFKYIETIIDHGKPKNKERVKIIIDLEKEKEKAEQKTMDTLKESDLSLLSQLQGLSLRSTGLNDSNGLLVSNWLFKVRHLDISYNSSLSESCIIDIFKQLNKKEVKLESVFLGGLNLRTESVSELFRECRESMSEWKHLSLRENPLGDDIIETLLGGWDTTKMQLVYLNLSATRLTFEGYDKLLSHPTFLQNISDLRLSENGFMDHDLAIQQIKNNISTLSQLTKISIGSAFDPNTPLPKEILQKVITISPFFCDNLD